MCIKNIQKNNKSIKETVKDNLKNSSPIDKIMSQVDAVTIYKKILDSNNSNNRFPPRFWKQEKAHIKAAECTRYLIDEVLKWDEEKVKKDFNRDIIREYKLSGAFASCFNSSIFRILDNAYPGKYNPLEVGCVPPKHAWKNDDFCKELIIWLIETKLSLKGDDITKLRKVDFINNGLGTMLEKKFDGSLHNAVNFVYTDQYHKWQFTSSKTHWTKEMGIEATKWMVETKMNLPDSEFKNQYGPSSFKKYNLRSMLRICFEGDAFKAIDTAYPGAFKKSDFKKLRNDKEY